MRKTSVSYRPFPVVRDVDLRISFSVMDTNAKKDETVLTYSEAGVFSNPGDTINDVNAPEAGYIALEEDLWRLDGSFSSLPDDAALVETGFWSSSVSDAAGDFASPVVFRYKFSAPISTLGWTMHFDPYAKQWASSVRVTAYDADGAVLDTGVYENDSPVMALQHYVGDYYAVEFAFLSTNEPLRRLRLFEVDFGLTKDYDRGSLGSARLVYDADLLSRSLPMRELVFTFDNADKQYNLLNPDGVYQYLQDGQEITAKIVIGGEAVDMGKFYFTKADVSKSGIAPEITAHDAVYRLDGTTFSGGTGAEMTLRTAVQTVLGGFDVPLSFDDGIGSTLVTLSTPADTTLRECVRMLAQAAMCTVYTDRDGVMRFTKLTVKAEEDGAITADELYDYSGVSIADRVDGVVLNVSSEYILDADGKAIRNTYTAGETGAGMMTVSFTNPCVAASNGAAAAAWLLAGVKMRKNYEVKNRCDPAAEIGDTLRIDDIFYNRETAVVTGIEIDYDGTLSAVTKGVGA